MTDLDNYLADLTGGDDDKADEAARKIAALGTAALPTLETLLGSDDIDTRWWAARALAGVDDPQAGQLLQSAMQDPDPAVRQCAALGLSSHPDPMMVPGLVACLAGKDQLLARLAGHALVAIGPEAVPALIDVMEGGPPLARLEAVKALAEIADPRAIPVFYKAIRDGDSQLVEYWSDVGLQKLGVGMKFFKP